MAKEKTIKERESKEKEYEEVVVSVDRVTRVVKGGRRLRFRALVVIGDRNGKVGMGLGKAGEVAGAVAKAVRAARKNLLKVVLVKDTIPHEIKVNFGSAALLLKPAKIGTGVIAGGTTRTIAELAGIKNLVAKSFGSTNKINNAYATFKALSQLRTKEQILKERGKG